MLADECKTALTELGLETKGIKRDELQIMLINYITKSVDPERDPVQTADPLLGRLPVYLASLSLEQKAKWFFDEERRREDREFELAKIWEERQAAAEVEERKAAAAAAKEQADLARIRDAEERKAAAVAAKEKADLGRLREERDAVLARMREEREAEFARIRLQNAAAEAAADAAARAADAASRAAADAAARAADAAARDAVDAAAIRAAERAHELALRELEVANPHTGQ